MVGKSPNHQSEENNLSKKIKSQNLMYIQTLDPKILNFLEIKKSKKLNNDLMVTLLFLSFNTQKKIKSRTLQINITFSCKIILTHWIYKMISETEKIQSPLLSSIKRWYKKSFHSRKNINKSPSFWKMTLLNKSFSKHINPTLQDR